MKEMLFIAECKRNIYIRYKNLCWAHTLILYKIESYEEWLTITMKSSITGNYNLKFSNFRNSHIRLEWEHLRPLASRTLAATAYLGDRGISYL